MSSYSDLDISLLSILASLVLFEMQRVLSLFDISKQQSTDSQVTDFSSSSQEIATIESKQLFQNQQQSQGLDLCCIPRYLLAATSVSLFSMTI